MDFPVDVLTETPLITCVAGRIQRVTYIIPCAEIVENGTVAFSFGQSG